MPAPAYAGDYVQASRQAKIWRRVIRPGAAAKKRKRNFAAMLRASRSHK